jgi:hypothetical protein
MNDIIQLTTTIASVRNFTNFQALRPRFLVIALVLLCFALLPVALAVNPPPDGGYSGGNTAEGQSALLSLSTGSYNTAVRFLSLESTTSGKFSTAIGAGTLLANAGDNNTATGAAALLSNTIGFYNTADGAFALFSNTEGNGNTASGYQALSANTTGSNNAAFGYVALSNNTDSFNTALGLRRSFTTSTAMTIPRLVTRLWFSMWAAAATPPVGAGALLNNQGSENIAIGAFAGSNLTVFSDNIDIGNLGVAGDDGTIRIGNNNNTATYLAGIAGHTVGAGGTTCYVDNAGKLGVFLSARRYKENIQRMDDASAALFSLKPVTFRYKPEFDKSGTPHFGLIAEEVAEVCPDLVTHDANGALSTVRYEAVSAMLLNEFLKEHRKVEQQDRRIQEQEATIAELRSGMKALATTVNEQAAQLRKVSAQVQMNNVSAQVVVSNH